MRLAIISVCAALSLWTAAEARIIADISKPLVEIDPSFAGDEVFVFGAIQPEALSEAAEQIDIVVILRGPARDAEIRQKSRINGVWVAGAPALLKDAPTVLYAFSSAPLANIAGAEDTQRFGLDFTAYEFSAPATETDKIANPAGALKQSYLDAFVAHQERRGLYKTDEDAVSIIDNALFRTRMELPANTPVGAYAVEVHLIRDRSLVASQTRPLYVEKTGLERLLYNAAYSAPFVYGVFCVITALLFGWGASALFRK